MSANEDVFVFMLLQAKITQAFHRVLLRRLAHEVPGFDLNSFIEELYVMQAQMPQPGPGDDEDYAGQCRLGLSEWGKWIETAEEALADTKPSG